IQRSLGFYTSSNPDVKLSRVIAMGGGTKLRGLLKYLQQTLQIPVEKPDAFRRMAIAPGLSSAKFHESVADFGVVYGLGLQGLGMARIESNLLPKSVARSMAWAGKTKYFLGAAVLFLAVSLMCLGRVGLDRIAYARNESMRSMNNSVVNRADSKIKAAGQFEQQQMEFAERIKKQFEKFKYRDTVAGLHELVISAFPNAQNNPEQRGLYEAFEAGDVQAVMEVPRSERKQLFITNLSVYFADDLATAQFGETAVMRKDAMMQMASGEDGAGYEDEMMADMREIYGDEYMRMMGYGETSAEEKHPGFVVSIVGYSPFKDIGALLDPPNVKEDRRQWGFVTRMENLNAFVDANSPFQLYSREAAHFRLRKGVVDLEQDVPMGVGVMEILPEEGSGKSSSPGARAAMGYGFINSGTQILVDPMTRERINAKVLTDQFGKPKYDGMGKPQLEIHDHWFSLDFKLEWAKAPADTGGASKTGTTSGR
ncbi:MAG: pilus assembly protein PilM, partial [Sedimentisphaerales bacterium]|nr:pilus assembly protein PilM [Sedimentisphaerales bacterium]